MTLDRMLLSSKTTSPKGQPQPAGDWEPDIADRVDERTHNVGVATHSDVDHVLGMRVFSNSALTSNPLSGVIAYPAGSVLVLVDSNKKTQTSKMSTAGKSITSVSFSPDGQLLLTGECGPHAMVRVWEVDTVQEVDSIGHFDGIECVAFTPSMNNVIVVGNGQDLTITVWKWPEKEIISLNKFSDYVTAMTISNDGSFFVTIGSQHMKLFFLDLLDPELSYGLELLPTKSVAIECFWDESFCDVICGMGEYKYIYALSSSGTLCKVNHEGFVENSVSVQARRTFCLATDYTYVYVGCAAGQIWMFTESNLQAVGTLPLPHRLGPVVSTLSEPEQGGQNDSTIHRDENDVTGGGGDHDALEEEFHDDIEHEGGKKAFSSPAATTAATTATTATAATAAAADRTPNNGSPVPGVAALVYNLVQDCLVAVYDDSSLYVWQRTRNNFWERFTSFSHGGCVWDFATYPCPEPNPDGPEKFDGAIPPGSLISVSADGTVRIWDLLEMCGKHRYTKMTGAICQRIVYADALTDRRATKDVRRQAAPLTTRRSQGLPAASPTSSYGHSRHLERRDELRVVAVCPEGRHIATGNRYGQLCIYDASTMAALTTVTAHDAEVIVLVYAKTRMYKMLVSGSRDRLIHLMDANNDYQLMSTMDDHSSTITAIRSFSISNYFSMVSSSLDMSVLVRTYTDDQTLSFSHVRAIVTKKAVVDFDIQQWSGQIALVCHDKRIQIHSLMGPDKSYSYRGCTPDGGYLVKVCIDHSGRYVLSACTKRTINLIAFESGEILKTYRGQADTLTNVRFSPDMDHVISSCADGCVVFWRLPSEIKGSMLQETEETRENTSSSISDQWWSSSAMWTRQGKRMGNPRTEQEAVYVSPSFDTESLTCDARFENSSPSLSLVPTNDDQSSSFGTNSIPEVLHSPGLSELAPPQDAEQAGVTQWLLEPANPSLQQNEDGASDMMMASCCRRRKLFKLQARSIKTVLTMMRLVTEAMVKDLKDSSQSETSLSLTDVQEILSAQSQSQAQRTNEDTEAKAVLLGSSNTDPDMSLLSDLNTDFSTEMEALVRIMEEWAMTETNADSVSMETSGALAGGEAKQEGREEEQEKEEEEGGEDKEKQEKGVEEEEEEVRRVEEGGRGEG